ncbi:MAG: gamma-glutamyltransferase family protein [Treponema sp.]|jgi:gamma-glutamyltranspeptidase/glutathione hydrolase|nr:gamma-glutamyltransferase family protein [Treponema sp.]
MRFDPVFSPYSSRRYPIYAREGMVAASSPQAAAAGLEALRAGGSAVDAAVAAAAALTVVEPTANGIGSDAFAIIWSGGKLHGLNASGTAPSRISIDKIREDYRGTEKMPLAGWAPVMVPGAPAAWAALNERFGRLPLTKVLAPAIAYAREGYPLAPNLVSAFARSAERFQAQGSDPAFAEWWKTFIPGGENPRPGDILVLKNHGDTLEAIANTRAEAFYRGELAERILADSREFGGYFSKEDFSSYRPEWVEPVSVNYRGYDVWELPPNGQGISALMALNILKEFSFTQRDRADTFHKQWEAMKLAFSDALAHITDPRFMKADYREWLSPEYGARRAREIGDTAALPQAEHPPKSGTVYLCTADREGGMVSYIQSNYMGFGSGVVVRGTGIALQNRGSDFSLDPGAPNCLAPGKKSYHTIIPGFLTKDGQALGPFGVMGGYMQPQGHVQVVTNLLDFGLNPQQALDAPRWSWTRGRSFSVEDRFSAEIARTLASMGHEVNISLTNTVFGRGQIILRLENGVLVGATESRTDSNIACW